MPVAVFTVTKLRWLAEHEPENADRMAAVCLPHDWLTWRLAGAPGLGALRTDRGDASGTGYWSPATGRVPARPAGAGLRRAPVRWSPAVLRAGRERPATADEPDGVRRGCVSRPRHR